MRDRPRRRPAAVVQTVSLAVLVAAALVAMSYGVQRVVLRSPTEGELTAARIEGALLHYRYSRATVHVAGEPTRRAECLQGWLPADHGLGAGRGAMVLFSDGERLVLRPRKVVRVSPGRVPTKIRPLAEIQLAGCTRAMTTHIYRHLDGHRRTHAVETTFHGRRALTLHLPTAHYVFDVYVQPQTLAPFGVRVRATHAVGWSIVEPVRPLTPELKRDFLRRFDG